MGFLVGACKCFCYEYKHVFFSTVLTLYLFLMLCFPAAARRLAIITIVLFLRKKIDLRIENLQLLPSFNVPQRGTILAIAQSPADEPFCCWLQVGPRGVLTASGRNVDVSLGARVSPLVPAHCKSRRANVETEDGSHLHNYQPI